MISHDVSQNCSQKTCIWLKSCRLSIAALSYCTLILVEVVFNQVMQKSVQQKCCQSFKSPQSNIIDTHANLVWSKWTITLTSGRIKCTFTDWTLIFKSCFVLSLSLAVFSSHHLSKLEDTIIFYSESYFSHMFLHRDECCLPSQPLSTDLIIYLSLCVSITLFLLSHQK